MSFKHGIQEQDVKHMQNMIRQFAKRHATDTVPILHANKGPLLTMQEKEITDHTHVTHVIYKAVGDPEDEKLLHCMNAA